MGVSGSSSFGDMLRRYRLAAGLSQERLAERTGLSVRGVSDLERGARRTPRLETVRRLVDGLELDSAQRADLLRAAHGGDTLPETLLPCEASHLPVPPTPIIGRDRELADLASRIRDPATRLLTLTGPGGVGKTRLALEVATMTAPAFPHGAHLVELAPLRDPTHVLQAIAHALGVHPEGGTPLLVTLQRYLRDRRLLLLIDNVEHVLPAAPEIASLLAASHGLTVLATSRVPLTIRGEHQHAIAPLAFASNSETASATAVAATPAGQLFVTRVRQVRTSFALENANAPAVAAICRRLDGLPLALELVAAHGKALSPAALVARLDRRLPMLTRGPRDVPERHQTLDATIAWSHDLLGPDERRLFCRLSVFAGGWTLDAAEAISGNDPTVSDSLCALVNASLVTASDSDGDEPRFTMLETIREFAAERLRESGEEADTRAAHAAWMLELVEQGGPELVGRDQIQWLRRFDQERDNLRAALEWAVTQGDAELAARIVTAAWQFWLTHSHATEGRRWIDRVLAITGGLPAAILGGVQYAAGTLAAAQDDYGVAEPMLEAAVIALRETGERAPLARALHTLGIIWHIRDLPDRAVPLLEAAIDTYDQPDHPDFGPWHGLAHSQLAGAVSRLGDHERATALATRGMALQREIGSELGVALGMLYHGDIALDQGDLAAARERYHQGIAILGRIGDRWYMMSLLTCWIIAAANQLPPRQIARLMGANAAIREHAATPVWPCYARPLAAAEERVRSRLSDAGFTRTWNAGAKLDLDAAIAEILAIEDNRANRSGAS